MAGVAFAATLAACSLVLGLKDGELPDAGSDAGDSGVPVDDRAVLKPDASTATCQGDGGIAIARTLLDDGDSVYVLQGGSTIVSSCGSKVDPCGTLAVGMEVANANRAKAVYVGPGTYAETLAIPSGVSVEGGFSVEGADWTPLCENITTVLAPPAAIVVEADSVLNAAIRFLTIETKAHGDPGESLFAVHAVHSALTIENVNIYAELGGGGFGGAGGTGTTGSGCAGSGGDGDAGAPGAPGTFSASGYDVGAAGGAGWSGAQGSAGVHTTPQCSDCVASCTVYTYPLDDAGIPIDDAGDEILDGATSTCIATTQANVCAGDVAQACGGAGGNGGAGGANGAASVAVFAIGSDSALTITGGALVSAGGGLGGPGGAGAPGAAGGSAATGNGASCGDPCDDQCQTSASELAGGSTTAGGSGGTGGAGGGGSGGPTYLVVTVGGAKVTVSQTSQWQVPATGAAGGAPNGPAGAFGQEDDVP